MFRATTWLPLGILALLVGLTIWLDTLVTAPAPRASGATRHDPDLIVQSFNAKKLGNDGRVLYTLVARKMLHYPDDDSSEVEQVTVEAFEPKQPKVTITADRGRLLEGGDQVWCEGNVVVVREADGKIERTTMKTDKLLVIPDDGIARTTSDVVFENVSGRVDAKGFEMNNQTRLLTMDKVRASFKPQPKTPR
jgi:lipopolysaccharide export system protein LptC